MYGHINGMPVASRQAIDRFKISDKDFIARGRQTAVPQLTSVISTAADDAEGILSVSRVPHYFVM